MPGSATAVNRLDLSFTYKEFDALANRRHMIGTKIYRPYNVPLKGGFFPKYQIAALLQQHDTKRKARAGYNRATFETTTANYTCEEFGQEVVKDDVERAVYRDFLDYDNDCAELAFNIVCDHLERLVKAKIYNTTTYTGSDLTTAITNEWDDHANADPQGDIFAAKRKIWASSGQDPNTLVLNKNQLLHCLQCDAIHEIFPSTTRTPGNILASLKDIFEIDNILVGGAMTNTADPPLTGDIDFIWEDEYMWLGRTASTDSPKEPCVGRTLLWNEEAGSVSEDDPFALITEEYYNDEVRGEVTRARTHLAFHNVHIETGHLLSNAITI